MLVKRECDDDSGETEAGVDKRELVLMIPHLIYLLYSISSGNIGHHSAPDLIYWDPDILDGTLLHPPAEGVLLIECV